MCHREAGGSTSRSASSRSGPGDSSHGAFVVVMTKV